MADAVLLQEAVEPATDVLVRRPKRLAIRVADLLKLVPVGAPGRKREGPAGRYPQEAAIRVQDVEQREEVVLVRAATVEEDERAGGIPRGVPCRR